MQNEGEESKEEVERLKKKINHLVIKIDAQRKERDTITRKLTNKYISDINLIKAASPIPEKNARQSLLVFSSKFTLPNEIEPVNEQNEEFEKIDDGQVNEVSRLELSKLLQSEKTKLLTKSNFNLQGPYWKNRTNKILK